MLEVIVFDRDGRVVRRVAVNEDLFNEYLKRVRESGNDLFTRWGLRFFRGIFGATPRGGNWAESYVDTGGTGRTQNIKGAAGSNYVWFNTYGCPNRLWMAYGTGTTTPTRDDYRLVAKVGEGVAGVTADEAQGTVTISASFTFAESLTVYEVGLEWEGPVVGYDVCGRVLVDRTVFPDGIPVSANQTLALVYRFIT